MKKYPRIGIILGIMVVFLSGCATTAKYNAMLAAWDGRHVDDLVMTWGPPQGSHKLSNGNTMIEYINYDNFHVDGHQTLFHDSHGITGRSTTYITRTPTYYYQTTCKSRFLIDPAGNVLNSSSAGDCYAE